MFYSVIVYVPRSRQMYEFFSPQKLSNAQTIVSFLVARTAFEGDLKVTNPTIEMWHST